MASLLQVYTQVEDSNGLPRSGAKAYTYVVGTTTPLTTYSDYGLTTPNANPIVADSEGVFAPAYVPSTDDVKVVLKTSADVTLRTIERVPVTSTPAAGSIATAQLADNAVTLAKLLDIATDSFLGRDTAGTGDPEVLTAAQLAGIVGTFIKLPSISLSGASAADQALSPTTYRAMLFLFDAVVMTIGGANFLSRISTDGTTYLSTSTYIYARGLAFSDASIIGVGNASGDTAAAVTGGVDSTASQNLSGFALVIIGGAAAHATKIFHMEGYVPSSGVAAAGFGYSSNSTTSQVTHVRFLPSTSTFASGNIHVYGLPR